MSDGPDHRALRLLGGLSIGIGFLASVESATDLHENGAHAVAVWELLLAQSAIIVGLALFQRRAVGSELAAFAASAAIVHYLVRAILDGPTLYKLVTVLGFNEDLGLWTHYGLQLLLIAVQALFWPVVLVHLYIDLQCRAADDPTARSARIRFWTLASAAAFISACVEGLVQAFSAGSGH